jgi:PmbA protein
MTESLGLLDDAFRSYLEQVLDLAEGQADQAEVFAVESLETPVTFEANRLKFIETKETRGVGLRVISDGRVGLASTSRLGEPGKLVDDALSVSRLGAQVGYQLPPAASLQTLDLHDHEAASWSPEAMVDAGKAMIDLLRNYNADLLCSAHLGRMTQTVALLNSNDVQAAYRRTAVHASVSANWIRGTDMLDVWEGQASPKMDVDYQALAAEVWRKVRLAERTAPATSGQMPVVFTPKAVYGTLLPSLQSAFNGKLVLEGASPLSNDLGKQVFDERITIHDNPHASQGLGSSPMDDEGVPTQELTLVEAGTVQSFIYDLQTAALAGTQSTGHGQRGVGSLPSPGLTNLVMAPGDVSPEEMIRQIPRGLLVDQTMGAWAGNVLAGEFSGNVHLGYLIENGELVGRVKDTMVAGNVFDAFNHVEALGNDQEWVGGAAQLSHVWFSSLGVAGKS